MIDTPIIPDAEQIAARAAHFLAGLRSTRDRARDAGDPNYATIGADAEQIAKDSIALANAIEVGALGSAVVFYFPPGSPDVLGAVSRLRMVVGGPVSAPELPPAASAPPAGASSAPAALPADGTDPRQLSSPALGGGAPPGAAGAPPARQEESAQPIDAFDLSPEQLEALPYDPEWVRAMLADFKAANAGQTAKRWITSFRAWLGKRPEADAHKRSADA